MQLYIYTKQHTVPGAAHYIPHHPVKKDSTTTPIRIVYDSSCRQSSEHPSLNNYLVVPPLPNGSPYHHLVFSNISVRLIDGHRDRRPFYIHVSHSRRVIEIWHIFCVSGPHEWIYHLPLQESALQWCKFTLHTICNTAPSLATMWHTAVLRCTK